MKILAISVIFALVITKSFQQDKVCFPDKDTSKNTLKSETTSWSSHLECPEEDQTECSLTYTGSFSVNRTRSKCCKKKDESDDKAKCTTSSITSQFSTNFTTLLQFSKGAVPKTSFTIEPTQSVIGNVDSKIWFRGKGSHLVLKGQNKQRDIGKYDPFETPQLKLMPQGRLLLGSFDAPENEKSMLTIDSSAGSNDSCVSQVSVYHGSLLMVADGMADVKCQDMSKSYLVVGSDTGFSAWSTDTKPELKVVSKGSCTSELSTKGRSQTFLTGSKIHVECGFQDHKGTPPNGSVVLGGYWSFSSGQISVKDSKLDVGTRSNLLGFHESSMKLHNSTIMLSKQARLSLDPRIGQVLMKSKVDVVNSTVEIAVANFTMDDSSELKVSGKSEFFVSGSHFKTQKAKIMVSGSKFRVNSDESKLSLDRSAAINAADSNAEFGSLIMKEGSKLILERSMVKVKGMLESKTKSELVMNKSEFSAGEDSMLKFGPETKLAIRRGSRLAVGDRAVVKLQQHTSLQVDRQSEVVLGEQAFLNLSAVIELRGSSKVIVEDRGELHAFTPVWCIISQDSKIHIHPRGRLIITSAYFTPGSFQKINIDVPAGQTKVWVAPYNPPKIYSVGTSDKETAKEKTN